MKSKKANIITGFNSWDGQDPLKGNNVFGQDNRLIFYEGLGNKSLEKFDLQEEILLDLKTKDEAKFIKIHKGIPYFDLALLSYRLPNIDSVLYYIDNAISEDIKNFPGQWDQCSSECSASCILQLKTINNLIINPIIENTIKIFQEKISVYNIAYDSNISVNDIGNYYFSIVKIDNLTFSLISSIYAFILEYERWKKELLLRSDKGASIAPFISHLFLGCVCVESLLKFYYPSINQLGKIYNNKRSTKSHDVILAKTI